jgi:hypothetical protein
MLFSEYGLGVYVDIALKELNGVSGIPLVGL